MAGKEAPPEYPPVHKRPKNSILKRMDALREWRKVTGVELGVASRCDPPPRCPQPDRLGRPRFHQ